MELKTYISIMEGWIDMAYKRKTKDVWQLITDYGYGKEVECEYEDRDEAKNDYKTYRQERKEDFLPNLVSIELKKRRIKL